MFRLSRPILRMIAGIFKKSKPINFIILTILIAFGLLLFWYTKENTLSSSNLTPKLSELFFVVFSIFIIDFIVKKNQLTKQNNFAILHFSLLFLMLKNNILEVSYCAANVFVLLALRRIISLKSNVDTTNKIFDAALWLSVATFIDTWAIFHVIVLYLGIIFYASKNYKHYLIPFVAWLITYIIINAFHMLVYDSFYSMQAYSLELNPIEFSTNTVEIIVLSLLFTFSIITFFSTYNKRSLSMKKSMVMVYVTFLIGVILVILNTNTAVFLLFPASVLIAILYQQISNRGLRELVTILIVISILLNYFFVI